MNKIEIRAWDPKRKVMVPSVGFSDSDCGRFWKREQYMIDNRNNLGSYDWVPMQSTGLKDKNGKKIYEGDIINHLSYLNSAKMVEEAWRRETVKNLQDFFERVGYQKSELGEQFSPDHLEVIGNIYENPELIN